jgi:anti-sigma B factor antagonist
MPDRFEITEDRKVNVLRLSLPDGIDTMEIDTIIDGVLGKLDGKAQGRWVTDLSDVSYMGSSMLGLMVNIRQRISQAGGKLILCGMKPQLLNIFQACCLERLFSIAKTRDDAIAMASR